MSNIFRLIFEFFKTGLFAVGGGLATLPFLYELGEKTGWFACQVPSDQLIEKEFFHAYSYDAKRKLQWTWDLAYPDDAWEMKMPFSFSGTEGGPITYTAENAEFPAVIGVYTSKGSDGLSYIRRLTLDVFNDMKKLLQPFM